jgi:hypothetical protein
MTATLRPSWAGLLARGLALTVVAAVAGTLAMLPSVARQLGSDYVHYLPGYFILGPIFGLIFAAPITLVLLPVLRRRGASLLWPAAAASALWMVAAPRLTGLVGPLARPSIDPDLLLILVGTAVGLAAAWLFAAWTRPRHHSP